MLEIILITNGVRTSVHGTQNTASLSEEANLASKLEFKVNYLDESFNNVFPRLTRVIAFDTVPSDVVFEGYVYSVTPKSTQSGEISKTVSCVHILTKLNDAAVVGFEDRSGSIRTIAGRILNIYNSTASDEDRIELGICPIDGGHNEVVHIFSATCLDALSQLIVTDAGWSFRTRYSEGKWYFDISDDFGEITDIDMIFGVNLIDVSKEIDASELYTRIIPIGGASHIPDECINPTMSNLHDPEGMPVTLYNYFDDIDRIYIANQELETKYPIIARVVQYDDIAATDDTDYRDAQDKLYERASYDASRLTDIVESYKASALDLARAGYNFSLIELNKMYRIVNNKLDIDTYLQVTSKKTNYDNPAKCELTFGAVGTKSSKWMSRKGKTTDQKVNAVGSTSYKTTNTRMGGMSMRNQSKSQYESETHDANTLYTVSDAGTGKVEMYLGDTKISGEGGWEVDTAAVLDANNVHQWIAQQELMADINASTKLLYGGNAKLAAMQGYACRFGSATLDSDDAELFGTTMEVDILWRTSSSGTPAPRKIKLELFVNNISTSSGDNRYTFAIVLTRYDGTTVESTETYTTTSVATNPTDAFIVATVSGISGETSYAGVSTPYGYIICNNVTINVGAIIDGDVTLLSMRSSSGSVTLRLCGTNNSQNTNSCATIESLAEKYLDLGITKRSEPHEAQGGGT